MFASVDVLLLLLKDLGTASLSCRKVAALSWAHVIENKNMIDAEASSSARRIPTNLRIPFSRSGFFTRNVSGFCLVLV
ncbi:hypothetical protein NPIL_334261 [Nephila pilipes]|uniref:Secreted protein n=1 Tax=Nephila pilipes TaxID=299642 RepID=A0A8X6MW77_NEPPI|nr:hypothetical protein NPIL_334261 [Nephila pilipes]